MGRELLILGHHYQQDEVIALADLRGDSYQLSQLAAASRECRAIAFCGVHFMAETADILANRPERLAERGGRAGDGGPARPGRRLLDGRHGRNRASRGLLGTACRSDRRRRRDAGHLRQFGGQPEGLLRPARRHRLHLGQRPGGAGVVVRPPPPRAVLSRSAPGPQHGPGDGRRPGGDAASGTRSRTSWAATRAEAIRRSRVLLWKGHCSVHQMFLPPHVEQFRRQVSRHQDPGPSRVHDGGGGPGRRDRLDRPDHSRGRARRRRARAGPSAPSCTWSTASSTSIPSRRSTSSRRWSACARRCIASICAHLCWALENLAAGTPVNVVRVDDETARWALAALQRMLEVRMNEFPLPPGEGRGEGTPGQTHVSRKTSRQSSRALQPPHRYWSGLAPPTGMPTRRARAGAGRRTPANRAAMAMSSSPFFDRPSAPGCYISVGVGRVNADGLAVIGDRLFEIAHAVVGEAPLGIGVGHSWDRGGPLR